MRLRGRHYCTQQVIDVTLEDGVIVRIDPAEDIADAPWLAPAFFDLQINGCHGTSFNAPDLTPDGIRHVVHVCRSHGISQLFPTLITGSFDALAHGFRTLHQACAEEPELARAIVGYHLEGPYISPIDGPRGAHPREHVRAPNWDEFQRWQDAAGGRIRLVTLAPEHEGAIAFITKLSQARIVVALGHTNAAQDDIRAAIDAGARLSTHLGNGAHAVLPRHPNYIWEQLAADELWASVIADGHHLPAAVVKCIARVKTPSRTILTCDAGSLAGSPPGVYRQWGQEFEVLPTGKIVAPGTSFLAGSWDFTDACVSRAVRLAEVSLADAIDMAGARPRELCGLPGASLEVGSAANLMTYDWQDDALTVRNLIG